MPTLKFRTNVKIQDEKAFILELSKFGADLLSKPEPYLAVEFVHNPNITFAGSFEPAFLLDIVSLDNLSPEKNEIYSKAFFGFVEEKLGVPHDRGYVGFNDPGRAYLGHKSTTFATIFGGAK